MADIRQEIDRERKERENEKRQMREQLERERKENERKIAELRNQLSRASLLTPQVNKVFNLVLQSYPQFYRSLILHHDQNNHHQLPIPPSTHPP